MEDQIGVGKILNDLRAHIFSNANRRITRVFPSVKLYFRELSESSIVQIATSF